MEPALLSYLRQVAVKGIPVRQAASPVRVEAKPHRSALDHQDEARRKVWEDVVKGRALLASASHLGLSGVRESPQRRSRR